MRSYKYHFLTALAVVAAMLFATGCTTEADYTMGEEFIPDNQEMSIRRRTYSGGKLFENGTSRDCPLMRASLYKTDSVHSANLASVYFGREQSDTFGMRTAGFFSQMLFNYSLDEERGWGYRPIFDSMQLALSITSFHGDTTYRQRFEVYEITSNEYFKERTDTAFRINFDAEKYIGKEPIFTFTFPDQDNGVYTTSTEVLLHETPATRDYVSRLMLLGNAAANDGMAKDTEGIYTVGNEKKFVDKFKGIYIVPADDAALSGRGAMYASDIEKTGMYLYTRSRREEDPQIIRDTTYMVYQLYLDPKTYGKIEAGNVSINTVEHDYSGVRLFDADKIDEKNESREEVLMGFVDGMGGVVTELRFTDEMLQSLADLSLAEDCNAVSVNQATLSIYVEHADYDYTKLDPSVITPVLNGAQTRLGMYTDYKNLSPVADYMYANESTYTIPYGGYLNRSLACYTMDISNFIQSLALASADNLAQDGRTVDFDKIDEKYRRIYLAPEAYGLFGFDRVAVIGGDGEVGGARNAAPVKLDMTYTVFK